MTFVLGLTGGIATGKSTIGKIFQDLGVAVVDGDTLARTVQAPGSPALSVLSEYFGKDILLADGNLNREKLGAIVFSSKEKLEQLNELLEPFLREEFHQAIEFYKKQGEPLLVVDIPLLYERNYLSFFDKIMVSYVPENIQLSRLMKRNHLEEHQAQKRIKAQWSIEKKKELADIVIDNSQTIEETKRQILEWYKNEV